eukprot:CAMPEP_0168442526 /NCGR_PEP_ID=MMETSP0228-20121227/44057_1 /TAXON_ID=133427 /ORGANISM="Protoceratium reticulatum, Strain CCCM 535 (=CCMP 1889)" /LENGTH=76 /DNA_ID=CAMNT_0008456897 /DNA_START=30 /DNA_END=257 /DNA_ORIENTATION=+
MLSKAVSLQAARAEEKSPLSILATSWSGLKEFAQARACAREKFEQAPRVPCSDAGRSVLALTAVGQDARLALEAAL